MFDFSPWCDLQPNDFVRLQVLADALEDEGDARCEGLRWLVENGRWPVCTHKRHYWWSIKTKWRNTADPHRMPDWMIEQLRAGQVKKRRNWMHYDSALDAILAACAAIVAQRHPQGGSNDCNDAR